MSRGCCWAESYRCRPTAHWLCRTRQRRHAAQTDVGQARELPVQLLPLRCVGVAKSVTGRVGCCAKGVVPCPAASSGCGPHKSLKAEKRQQNLASTNCCLSDWYLCNPPQPESLGSTRWRCDRVCCNRNAVPCNENCSSFRRHTSWRVADPRITQPRALQRRLIALRLRDGSIPPVIAAYGMMMNMLKQRCRVVERLPCLQEGVR